MLVCFLGTADVLSNKSISLLFDLILRVTGKENSTIAQEDETLI